MSKFKYYCIELRRRHVVKAGIAYLVSAWLIIQVLSILFPAFQASPNALKKTIIFLGVGFPIWLIIAWIYDFSSDGIKKTDAKTYNPDVFKRKNIGLNRFIVGGLSIAVVLLVFNTFRMQSKIETIDFIYQQALASNFSSSIAVLAFDNLSPNKGEDFFAKGLSREIQQRLTKLKEIKVISTNSTFEYTGKDISIEVIGEELSVSYLLAGNVIKTGNTYRANIELISTENGEIIWAKQFDGNIENILDTYDTITKEVANYLKVTFDVEDIRNRKVDPEAYLLFLKTEDTLKYHTKESIWAADSLIKRSIKIDPTYAPSHTFLSMTTLHKGVYWGEYSKDEAIKIGKSAALKALELDPTHFRGYTWLSNWNWHERDVEGSMRHLDSALKYAPNNYEAMNYTAHQYMRTNRLNEALRFCDKGIKLNPKSLDNYNYKLYIEIMLGDYKAALNTFNVLSEFDNKEEAGMAATKALVYLLNGDPDKALIINEDEQNHFWYLYVKEKILYNLGRINEADSLIREINLYPNDSIRGGIGLKNDILAMIYANREDNDLAFEYLDRAYDYYCSTLGPFFTTFEFKNLYTDPRWNTYIDRLRQDFNYEFPYIYE